MAQKKGGKGRKKKNDKLSKILFIVLIAVLIIALLVYLIGFGGLDRVKEMLNGQQKETTDQTPAPTTLSEDFDGEINSYTYSSVLSGKSDFTLPSQFDGTCLEVHFLNIGQGDAIVIMLPDGKIFVIDAGSTSTGLDTIRTNYLAYLADNLNVDKIEYLLITHPDTDHYNMAGALIDAYDVDNIIYNNNKEKTQYTNFLTKKVEKEPEATLYPVNEEYFYLQVADTTAGYCFDIYAPGDTGFTGAESKWNSMSIMCVLTYGGRKVMFTGDGEKETEAWFMEKVGGDMLDVDVLKVGHHGSRSCTSTAFVDFIKPEYAVISCDDGTEYGHPHAETMTTLNTYGIVTYRTNRHGDITLYMDSDGDFAFLPQIKATVENNTKNRDPRAILLKAAA